MAQRSLARVADGLPFSDAGCKTASLMHAPEIAFPGDQCCSCGGALHTRLDKSVSAVILHIDGWKTCTHVPKRCRKETCLASAKYLWHNYLVQDGRLHMFRWPGNVEMRYFFLTSHWGVTRAWLRQMSQRLCHQFISFESEAEIHAAAARRDAGLPSPPSKADDKLRCAWLAWRLVLRCAANDLLPDQPQRSFDLDLNCPLEVMCAAAASWYAAHMLNARVQMHASVTKASSFTAVVIDGNSKLTRRVCGHDVGAVLVLQIECCHRHQVPQ